MPRAARKLSKSGFYHVVLYANGRQNLFEDDADRRAFLGFLVEATSRCSARVLAWCLMSNHVHLLIEDPEGGLGEVMRSLETSYAQRFNSRGGHVGHVFKGRYYSNPVETEPYLLEAMRYIHNNPAKAGVCAAGDYPWSSYHEYVGEPEYSDTTTLLEMLGGVEGFVSFSSSEERVRYRPSTRPRISDSAAEEVAKGILGTLPVSELKGMEKVGRDAVLCELREAGLSVRQIERLTGIGANTITRASR